MKHEYVKIEEAVKWINKNIRNYIENDKFIRIYDFIEDFEFSMKNK